MDLPPPAYSWASAGGAGAPPTDGAMAGYPAMPAAAAAPAAQAPSATATAYAAGTGNGNGTAAAAAPAAAPVPGITHYASGGSTGSIRSDRSSAYPAYPGYATYAGAGSAGGTAAGEVKLSETLTQRRTYEDLANFYSIIKALDVLECAFTKDAVTSEEYSAECNKLLAQWKTQQSALQRSGAIKDTADFMMRFKQLHCPHAMNRINEGKPATHALERAGGSGGGGGGGRHVNSLAAFEAASQVITAKDEIAMDITRVMDIHPLLRDIVDSFSRFEFPGDGKAKIVAWVAQLNELGATDELSAEDKQQMDFDLQLTYDELHKFLKSKQK